MNPTDKKYGPYIRYLNPVELTGREETIKCGTEKMARSLAKNLYGTRKAYGFNIKISRRKADILLRRME